MSFVRYTPTPVEKARQGPMRVTVEYGNNRGTTIKLSAATRDWLRPTVTVVDREKPWLNNDPTMRLEIRIDEDSRVLMIARVDDTETGEHVIEVRGMNTTAYFRAFNLHEDLKLEAGHYECIEKGSSGDHPYVVINMDAVIPVQQQATKTARELSKDLEAQMKQIRDIRDEGITTKF